MKHKNRTSNLCKSVTVTGAGCLRADRFGTLEADGQALLPVLAERLTRQGVAADRPFAGRVTVTVELWGRPVQAHCRFGRRGGGQ